MIGNLFAPVASGSPKELYDYQQRALDLTRASLANGHRRPLLQLPTGAGKTVIAGAMTSGALVKGKRVIFTVPRTVLVDQTVASFMADGIDAVGVMQGYHPLTDPDQPVQVCSLQTLARRKIPPADLVIIDEAHITFESAAKWMADPAWSGVTFIGLSATPWTRGLGQHFDDLIKPVSMQELIDHGRLSKFRVFSHGEPDVSGVRTRGGDFDQQQLAEAIDTPAIVGDIVRTWREKGEDRPTIAYCVNRAHAQHLAQLFAEAGLPCAYVDCYTSDAERAEILRKFKSGEIKIIANVGVLTTGFDSDVRCIVDAKPTRSEMLFVQTIGRGLRTAPDKKDCLILDHAGNFLRLGMPTDIDYDELDDGSCRSGSERRPERRVPLPRLCEKCNAVLPPKTNVCTECGHEHEVVSLVQHRDGQLVELGSGKSSGGATVADRIMFYRELKYIARECGYQIGWAKHKYKERFGGWPPEWIAAAAMEFPPSLQTRNWVKSRRIAFAKARRAG